MTLIAKYFAVVAFLAISHEAMTNLTENRQTQATKESVLMKMLLSNETKKLPQAIIIGAKKCGTRALLKFIGAHHNISTAGAEVHFFDRNYHLGLDWYREQMPYSNDYQITIEKTPKYFIDKEVPKRVYEMNPKVKLIIVLRDPVTRAVSEYTQSLTKFPNKTSKTSFRDFFTSDNLNYSKKFENLVFGLEGEIRRN